MHILCPKISNIFVVTIIILQFFKKYISGFSNKNTFSALPHQLVTTARRTSKQDLISNKAGLDEAQPTHEFRTFSRKEEKKQFAKSAKRSTRKRSSWSVTATHRH
jgi:hypothetical protein